MVELLLRIRKIKSIDTVLVNLLYLFVVLLPLTYYGTIEVGFTVKLSEIVMVIAFALWAGSKIVRRDFTWKRTLLDLPLLGFWVIAGLSLINAIDLERGVAWWLWLSFYIFGVYYLIANVINDQKRVRGLLRTYVLVAVVVSLFALVQYFLNWLGVEFIIRHIFSKSYGLGYPRPHATLLEPLYFGFYLLVPSIFVAVSFLSRKQIFFRLRTEGFLLWFFSTVLISTLSRGAIVAFVGAFVVLILGYLGVGLFDQKDFSEFFASLWPRFALFLMAVVLAFPAFWGMNEIGLFLERISSTPHAHGRVELEDRVSPDTPRYGEWKNALRVFEKNLILGIGFGNYGPTKIGATRGITGGLGKEFVIVNNEPLEVAAETGGLGLLFYLCFNAVFAWRMFWGIRESIRKKLYDWTPIFIGFLVSFLAMSAQFLTFSTIQIGSFWFILGAGAVWLALFERKISS